MTSYYSQKLSAERLYKCYKIAPPRVKRYLEAEIEYVLDRITHSASILELGCGYGRVLERLATRTGKVAGIDVSHASLCLAREMLQDCDCSLFEMDAITLGFKNEAFDVVVCIQNGISAFRVDRRSLMKEAVRVAKTGGIVLFSSYSERFWEQRLAWFQLQARHGLIGEIDEKATQEGTIVCKDGFKAGTIGVEEFQTLTSSLGLRATITEVDRSCIFCEISP